MGKRLTSAQLSARPGYPTEWTMSRWRRDNIGPPYQRIGGRVFYDLDEVEAWERSNRHEGDTVSIQLPPDPALDAKQRGSELLTSAQLAALTGFPNENTLCRWRRVNAGPPFVRIGWRIFYDQAASTQWLETCALERCNVPEQRMNAIRRPRHDESGDTPQ